MLGGLPIIVSELAVEDSDERLFPFSKNRSRRIHKKLVRRFGGEFRKKPCAYQMDRQIVMHPALYAQMKLREDVETRTCGTIFGRNPW
jgi:hypothetical protein